MKINSRTKEVHPNLDIAGATYANICSTYLQKMEVNVPGYRFTAMKGL